VAMALLTAMFLDAMTVNAASVRRSKSTWACAVHAKSTTVTRVRVGSLQRMEGT
jgi:hypothetical protein